MMLYQEMEHRGARLFRWRSFIPFLVLPMALYFGKKSGIGREIDDHAEHLWLGVCMAISVTGLLLRALTVGFAPRDTSGRNTRRQKAESLNTTGMYSIVRHPIYFANFVVFSGFVLMFRSPELFAIAGLLYYIYYLQIMMAEERFLFERFGEEHTAWTSRTPAFWPRPTRWRRPALPFSLRTTLRREASTILLVSAVFFAMEAVEDLVLEHMRPLDWWRHDSFWLVQFVLVVVFYLTVRWLKKNTALLRVAGR